VSWRVRYLFAEVLIFVGVTVTYFVVPEFFPLALVIILVPISLVVVDWARDGRQPPSLPPISLKTARVYLAMEMFGLTAAILGEVIKMDRGSLLALVAVAILVGYVLGRGVWARAV